MKLNITDLIDEVILSLRLVRVLSHWVKLNITDLIDEVILSLRLVRVLSHWVHREIFPKAERREVDRNYMMGTLANKIRVPSLNYGNQSFSQIFHKVNK
jgi:hypothetical protein